VYGVGCQNKVLEAMASATPVVATPRAVAALDAQPGRDVFVAEGPQAFAEAVLTLLDDPGRRRRIGQAGRIYVETHHRWDRIAAQLEACYEELLAMKRATSRYAHPALQLAH
jgi:glycosyltransferase involved in cell wall biosynthesis